MIAETANVRNTQEAEAAVLDAYRRIRWPQDPEEAIELLCRLAATAGWDHADLLGRVDFAYLAELQGIEDGLEARNECADDDPRNWN